MSVSAGPYGGAAEGRFCSRLVRRTSRTSRALRDGTHLQLPVEAGPLTDLPLFATNVAPSAPMNAASHGNVVTLETV